MNTPVKLGAYAAVLAVVFAAALGVGSAVGDVGGAPPPADHSAAKGHTGGAKPSATPEAAAPKNTPGGLQVSENGYTLTPITTTVKPDVPTDFRFTVTGPDGEAVTDYQVQHEKKLHLILVSRDLGTFQHLHPAETGDGVWSVKVTLPDPGAYRVFADFAPTGGSPLTLGADLLVAGDYTPKPLPAVERKAEVDGYTVELAGDVTPGRSAKLTLTVSKDGKPVTDLQPYLGAYGHLVALRGSDLAYLHVHPDGEPGDGKTQPGPEIVFHTEVPSRGDYRLFLDFQHDGKVRTADFTVNAGGSAATPAETPAETSGESGGHDDDHKH
ncbi:hypothetical protein [Sinosporangium siamense]|uniref:Secreted protein n=1 Tax=Sinosporangium siamense TaxID=1367973 RepID=A0A919V710_9ACTN|nr:hypothetical protein [Sinosporangium siamense]GII91592.1 hypothetical protein Ssi02_18230 [Sinosporangium siamense]